MIDLNVYCLSSMVPNFQCFCTNENLWVALKDAAQGVTISWLICGNFNMPLYPYDRIFGNHVHFSEVKDFSYCIHDLLLNELACKGQHNTWSNK